jgi:hypothetical protein
LPGVRFYNPRPYGRGRTARRAGRPNPLVYNSGWLSGFLDSDGSIYINYQSDQVFITASQKNKEMLNKLVELYGGKIYDIKKVSAFKWTMFRKEEIIKFLEEYIKYYPLKSGKQTRFLLLSKYYELRELKAHLAPENSKLGEAWKEFVKQWEEYEIVEPLAHINGKGLD